MSQTIDQVFRDYNTQGVPSSGEYEPDKKEIRALLKMIQNSGGQAVTRNTLTALNGVTPPTENYMGVVLTGPGAGYYSREGGAWVFGRSFPDSVAVFAQTGGTGNAIIASVGSGVDPSVPLIGFLVPTQTNGAGGVTINLGGSGPAPVLSSTGAALAAGELVAGRITLLVKISGAWRLLPFGDSATFAYRGSWSGATMYAANDLVSDDGSIWMARRANNNVAPVEGTDWTLWLPGVSVADESVDAEKLMRSDRLDMLAKLGVEEKGANLVEKMLAGVPIRGMYIRGTNNGFNIGIGMSADLKSVVEYRFRYNTDNVLLLRGGYSGVESNTANGVPVTLTGTFTTSNASQSYTTAVGAKFSFSFTGRSISFDSLTDNRGGVWQFTLSDGQQKRVSTWSSTSKSRRIMLFEGLLYDTYQCVAEFLGDDPINAPTGGTSRGWLRYSTDGSQYSVRVGRVSMINEATQQDVIHADSIPDFAISARPASAAYSSVWVPQHGSTSGVSTDVLIKVIVDGETIVSTAGGKLDGSFRECETVEIIQSFNAKNPNGSDGTLWQHWISHSISKHDPRLRIKNRLEISQDTKLGASYFAMLPGNSGYVERLLFNDRTEISPVPADDSDVFFGYERSSAMYAGEYASGNWHGCAMAVSSLRDAGGLGTPNQPTNPGRLNHRSDGVSKVYFEFAEPESILYAGETHSCETQLAVVSGIRQPNPMLKNV